MIIGDTPRTPLRSSIYRGADILARHGSEAFSRYLGLPSGSGRLAYSASKFALKAALANRKKLYKARRKLNLNKIAPEPVKMEADQGRGDRYIRLRKRSGGRKPFRISKLLRSTCEPIDVSLGWRVVVSATGADVTADSSKYLMSEFNPGSAGFMPILQCSKNADLLNKYGINMTTGCLPMHVYDLSYYPAKVEDSVYSTPSSGGTDANRNICDDTNSRAWFFAEDKRFHAIGTGYGGNVGQPRYRIVDANLNSLTTLPNNSKVYKKGVCVDMMCYGTKKMPTEYDIKIIRITDPIFCPDYIGQLSVNDYNRVKQGWEALVRGYVCSPLIRGVEPRPRLRNWFKVVCQQRVKLGEQTSEIDNVTSTQLRLYAKVNEVQNMAWSKSGFTVDGNVPDTAPMVDDAAVNYQMDYKPWYTSRLYLVIRALSTFDNATAAGTDPAANNDQMTGDTGIPAISYRDLSGVTGSYLGNTGGMVPADYIPSYDLIVRQKYVLQVPGA